MNNPVDLAHRLSRMIIGRRGDIATNVSYYKGTEGRMRFASEEFKDYFERRFSGFSDNWCMPVAQAPIERIQFLGIRPQESTDADKATARTWERNDASRGLTEALTMMTVAKRAYGLVSPTSAGARITFEHPDSAAVLHDPVTRERIAGLTVWADDRYELAELQTPSWVYPLRREKMALSGGARVAPGVDGWDFHPSKEARRNPLGAVGLVEFQNHALLDNDPISDIAGVMAMQDSINLVWAYLLNALDYASLPARLVTGIDVPQEPVLDDAGQQVGTRPIELERLIKERILFLGPDAKAEEWSAANLEVFSKVIEQGIEHIAAQTRTPPTYLSASASNVPATGYELSEAGLVSKTNERIGYATPVVREINRLAAVADGDLSRAEAVAAGKVLWRKPQYRSEEQLMDGLQKLGNAGFPFQWIAEEYGLSPAEVQRVMTMKRDELADPYLDALGTKIDAAEVG